MFCCGPRGARVHDYQDESNTAVVNPSMNTTVLLPPHLPIRHGFDPIHAGPPSHTIPMEEKTVGHFLPSFDQRLWMFHRAWEITSKTNDPPIATLMILHGTVDHSGVYKELAQLLLQQHNIAVFAMDMRGWGRSDGERMYVDSIQETFVQDVVHLYHYIHNQEKYQNVKHRFLLGKSLGGLVAAHAIAQHANFWQGFIGLSGAFEIDPKVGQPNTFQKGALQFMIEWTPKLPFKHLFHETLIVKDPQALQQWRDDPLCSKERATVGYIWSCLHAIEHCLQSTTKEHDEQVTTTATTTAIQTTQKTIAEQIHIPILILCGDEDQVVTPTGNEQMARQTKSNDKKCQFYKGGYHNLLQEPVIRQQVMQDIAQWIVQRSE